ncbi:MAG: ribbon-helix-helix domain-containing protein [Candidatus Thermoplasmatota archaeon]
MKKQRITIRLSQQDIHSLDLFVRFGGFGTRSEVIRRAISEYIKNYADDIIEKANKIKKVQEMEMALESVEPYMEK